MSTEPGSVDPDPDAPRSQAPASPPPVPKWTAFFHYPVVAGTAVLAAAVTVAIALDRDVSWLFDSPLVRRGQLWRPITSVLPHIGPVHLVFNVYWLWIFGTTVERVFGRARTLGLMLLLAYGSGALEYAVFAGGVGLSGVVYGLFGFLWVLSRKDVRFAGVLDARTIRFFVGWFFACIVLTALDVFPVANVAHGAGAVLGALAGFAVAAEAGRRRAFAAAIAAVLLFGTWAVTLGRPVVNLSSQGGGEECRAALEAYDAKMPEEAAYWFRVAVRYRTLPDVCWNNLAWALVESADPAIRNPVDALTYAQKAVASESGAKNAAYLDTLAAAYFANGQCESALKTQREALSLAEEKYREELQKRLERYQGASKTDACRRE